MKTGDPDASKTAEPTSSPAPETSSSSNDMAELRQPKPPEKSLLVEKHDQADRSQASRRFVKAIASQSGDLPDNGVPQFGAAATNTPVTPRGQINDAESLAELLNRLGPPPESMVDELLNQFSRYCESNRAALKLLDLNDWLITRSGKLLPMNHVAKAVAASASRHASPKADDNFTSSSQDDDDIAKASLALRGLITGASRPLAIEPQRLQEQPDARGYELPSESGILEFASEHEASLSDAEKVHRDQIADLFTAALRTKFGEEVIGEKVAEEPSPRVAKPQPMVIDKRFNWNLVLGIGSAVVALSLLVTGYKVVDNRNQRATESTSTASFDSRKSSAPKTAIQAVADPSRNEPKKHIQPEEQTYTAEELKNKFEIPAVTQEELKEYSPLTGSVLRKNSTEKNISEPDVLPWDVPLETEQSTPSSEPTVRIETGVPQLDASDFFPLEMGEPEAQSSDLIPNGQDKGSLESPVSASPIAESTSSLADLKSLPGENLDDDSHEAEEIPQEARSVSDQHIALPLPNDLENVASVPLPLESIAAIELPINSEITLQKVPSKGIAIIDSDAEALAKIVAKSAGQSELSWGGKGSVAGRMMLNHARLADDQGKLVYLRPVIQTDAYPLSLSRQNEKPTWDLGTPILAKSTRLEVNLSIPDELDFGWEKPLESTNPSRGQAIAIVTPKDGETVAVGVIIDLRCTRKLTCHLTYYGRLDQSRPWQAVTEAGLRRSTQYLKEQIQRTEQVIHFRKQVLDNETETVARRNYRRQIEQIETDLQGLEATQVRATELQQVFLRMAQQAKLELNLYAQWPDAKQMILTTSPQQETSGE